jgi:minimal PKS acyl carrier protein
MSRPSRRSVTGRGPQNHIVEEKQMSALTVDELKEILRERAGEDEYTGLAGDISDAEFADLGYDSLAMFEVSSEIKKRYRVVLPEDVIGELPTPRGLIDYVNQRLAT